MALDTINPCESPAGWKAIRRERYLNSEVAKFCQISLSQERRQPQCARLHHPGPKQTHFIPSVEALHLPQFIVSVLVLSNQGKMPALSHYLVDSSSQMNSRARSGCWLASTVQGSAALMGQVPPIRSPDVKLKNKFLMRTTDQVRAGLTQPVPCHGQ